LLGTDNFNAEGLTQAKARASKRLTMPILALGGSNGVGDALRATVATIGDRVQGARSQAGRGPAPEAPTRAAVTFSRRNALTN